MKTIVVEIKNKIEKSDVTIIERMRKKIAKLTIEDVLHAIKTDSDLTFDKKKLPKKIKKRKCILIL